MQQNGSKYFAHRPQLLILGIGSKDRTSTFSEHDHVAYQIKGNQVSSNVVANILPGAIPPPSGPLGWVKRLKLNFFTHGHVAYQHDSKYFARRPPSTPRERSHSVVECLTQD